MGEAKTEMSIAPCEKPYKPSYGPCLVICAATSATAAASVLLNWSLPTSSGTGKSNQEWNGFSLNCPSPHPAEQSILPCRKSHCTPGQGAGD